MRKKQVVIVGGGFGGVKSALELAGHPEFHVTLVANKPNFEYPPALYHTATGGSRVLSSIPLAELFAGKRIDIVVDTVTKLHRKEKEISLEKGKNLEFDILIMALGVTTNYFGIPGMAEYSYGIKTLKDAEAFKAHLHHQLIEEKKPDAHYIIVGGGPTGIELAGALPPYIKELMKQHGVKRGKVHVDLVEAAPRLMPRMSPSVSKAIQRRLRRLGIRLYLNTPVQSANADTLLVNGKPIRSHTVVWTAGIANNPFFADNHFMLGKTGRVQVDNLMQAWPGIFVIGDNAETQYTGMAQTALHDAVFVTKNLIRHAEGKRPYAYKAKRPIYVTPAGKRWAAVVWGPVHLYGWIGWTFRKAADWIGYHDVEPWWKATGRALSDGKKQNECLVCATKVAAIR
jgi:NADH dehydrogenase